uniref:Putative leucine rich repeat some n=1 Tax=Lutzomyia longipalpis TaxID=7200 RepID=A0A1B0CEC0_LUTLO
MASGSVDNVGMQLEEENPDNLSQSTTFLDLPLVYVMPIIAQYLRPKELFALRCVSQYCKQVVDDVGFAALGIVDLTDSGCGWRNSRYNNMREEIVDARTAMKKRIMQKCRKAWKLKIDERWLTDYLIHDFLRNNPSLEALHLVNCSPISNEALQPLLNCKNFSVLKVPDTQCGDDEFLRSLGQHNKQLLELDLEDSNVRTFYSPTAIKNFVSKQPHLRYICLPYIDDFGINHKIIETIVEICKDLESIKLAGWRSGDDRPLLWLAESCKKLKEISLGDLNWRENREIVVYMTAKGINFHWGTGSNCYVDIEGYIFHDNSGDDDSGSEEDEVGILRVLNHLH